jgi:predicted RND superfamily exporter protein
MIGAEQRVLDWFYQLTARPRLILTLSGLFVLLAGGGLIQLEKDTSVRAFIPADHSSVLTEDRITEVFGLSDPLAVAVMTRDGSSIFTPRGLETVRAVTRALEGMDNVRAERIASLATESSIAGDDGAVLVDPYIPRGAVTEADAVAARERWRAMPPHVGTLVAQDESGAVILAELVDPEQAVVTYESARALVEAHARPGIDYHVAGPAAVSAFLSSKIDADARLMQPLVFVIVLGFIFVAFRRIGGLLGPIVVLLGAVGGAMGIMGWLGISYFAITNALPVIVVAIAVADAIHVTSVYYQLRAVEPDAECRDLVVRAMGEMARPITLTTMTTMAGFAGIGLASIMPPITYFAWFAALGVALAWVFSIITLPNALVLLNLRPSPAFASWADGRPNQLGALFQRVSTQAARHWRAVIVGFAATALLAGFAARGLEVDRSQVENFAPDEPIRVADELINARFAGTSFLDVVIDAEEPGGLLRADRMAKIAKLQAEFESMPHVDLTVGITDYLSLLHRAIHEIEGGPQRALPAEDDAIAQYLLVYEASGDPTDFEEEIDSGYQSALVRGVLDSVYFSETRRTVEALEQHIVDEFNEPGLTATLGGDVNITYHWMSRLKASHFNGVALSLAMVLGMAMLAFRSIGAGILSVIPVTFTVVTLYALMASLGVYLEPATSMFAAISVGVGVDFAIHMVDRLRVALRLSGNDIEQAIAMAVPGTARASFFNAAALGIGFSVLLASGLPMLQRFGGLVGSAALVSFLVSLVVVPACYAGALELKQALLRRTSRPRTTTMALLLAALAGPVVEDAHADTARGLEIAKRVAERAEGELASRIIEMTLIDRRGGEKTRKALVLKNSSSEQRLTRITYLAPKAVRNTTFLGHDWHAASRPDERWLYIPAARKVRRIPASDRGDYFLGTDFTYEDIQSELKFELSDYSFRFDGTAQQNGRTLHTISGEPQIQQIASELGYGAFEARVDARSWLPLEIDFFDLGADPLKTIRVTAFERIDGIWTATRIEAEHHQTEHRTVFRYVDVAYPDRLPPRLFDPESLSRRLPASLVND